MPLWKQHPSSDVPLISSTQVVPKIETMVPPADPLPRLRPAITPDHATLTREVVVSGLISGTDALYVDGVVEGSITIPNERVTIGPNGRVHAPAGQTSACITAREIIVLGQVEGSVYAEERVEIRANGSVTGEISTVRVSIEDGAFFRGGIDIRKPTERMAETMEREDQLAGAAV